MGLNVQFVYGAGNDALFGGALYNLWVEIGNEFGDKIWRPRIIDWTERVTLERLITQWQDPTILVGHSCGCYSVTEIAVKRSMEKIPYLMAIAPSMFCSPFRLPPNVSRATQVTSNMADIFNLGGRQLLKASAVNNTTKIDVIASGKGHLFAPGHPEVARRLKAEIARSLTGV